MRGLLQKAAGLPSHGDRAEEIGCRRVAAEPGLRPGPRGEGGGQSRPAGAGGRREPRLSAGGPRHGPVEPSPALCPPAPDDCSARPGLAAGIGLRAAAGREPGSPLHCWQSSCVLLAHWRRGCHLHRLGPFTTLWGLCRTAHASCSPGPHRG